MLYDQLIAGLDTVHNTDGISGERLAERFDALSEIGLTEDNGSNRPGFSKEEKAAKELIATWMREAGLDVSEDGAGNIFGRMAGKQDDLPAVVSGSHVDSVPNGGHFDGVLGVLAALEVAQAWKQTGYQPEKPYEVAVFTDEEGARFNGGLLGSEAVAGKGDVQEKLKLIDQDGMTFTEVLADVGLTVDGYTAAERDADEIEMLVEVHIEQGKRLEQQNLPCGIVTGIAGPCWMEFTFTGEAGHAGNTPMTDRKDALAAAGAFAAEVPKLPKTVSDSAVATIGKLDVHPNGVNVIPGSVTLYVDIRDIYAETRDALVDKVLDLAEQTAASHQIKVEHVEKMRVAPVPIDEEKQELLAASFREKNIEPYRLPSGAGHDAMIIGDKWPVAMLFTRSKDGISHNPDEWSELNDCVQTVHVLKDFLEKVQQ
ncbi:M20 family metallo-hydrolase [Lentibacillus cibarius]|uniref:M20 family metallo-hydrolase n=1 Tax=Lentibacillus cibarius TaxID=2583219 RepID=A0A5S3QQ22_9BACI|nr:M20 family metallo-hydrolase [Lentibacillus cibarius]TMN23919.1 M20 family metallo-hydrolase [Lentibacillus cibarius]